LKLLKITIEIPEEYEDICPELIIEDMKIHEHFVIRDFAVVEE